MPDITEIEQLLRRSFTGRPLSADERHALRRATLTGHDRARLRSALFDWVRTETPPLPALAWLEDTLKLLLPPAPEPTDEVYFSPGADCLDAIRRTIRGAISTLDICVFTISDDRISDEILAAHRRPIAVRILSDNEKLYDTGSDIRRLAKAGLPIRIDETTDHMHHKFAVVDQRLVITGSYNWTRSAAEYNHENIVITESAVLVRAFAREFDRLWERLPDFS